MNRLVPIVALVVLGLLSYGAFVIVSNSKTSQYKQEAEAAKQALAEEKKARASDVQALKDKQQKIQESLVIFFPDRKEQIENAFNPKPTSQPTTAPTSQPVK